MNELCIRCGKPTPYHPNTPITLRRYFVEGSGQLCEQCYFTLYPVPGALQSNLGDRLDQQSRSEEHEEQPVNYSE
ncbi:MAG: hypothetical protein IKF06_04090 [Lachnospiraceae bacterium]|nr:hypothetical protein [Lachnospiraceae bacterium]